MLVQWLSCRILGTVSVQERYVKTGILGEKAFHDGYKSKESIMRKD